jgi:hypothetical protein
MGRYGYDPLDRDDYEYEPQPRQSRPRIRIRIKTEPSRPIETEIKQFPAKKAKKKRSGEMYEANEQAMSVKEFIKRTVLDDERLSSHDIAALIEEAGYRNPATIVTISNIRAEFRDSLKLIKTLGWRQPKPKP